MNSVKNRLFSLAVLALCYGYSLICGRANRKISKAPETVIVFHGGKLGDMVCATPIFRAIKKKYPACKVVVFGDKVNKEIVAGNLDVDEYVIFKKGDIFHNMKAAKQFKADFACVLTPSFSNLASLFLSGIRTIAAPKVENGWSPYQTRSYVALRKLVVSVPHFMGKYAPREYLRLLEPIGINTNETTKHLSFSETAKQKVDAFIAEKNIKSSDLVVCVSPSAGNAIKRWGTDKFSGLITRIMTEYDARIILIGGKNDSGEVAEVLSDLDKFSLDKSDLDESGLDAKVAAAVTNTCGLFNLDELKALIRRMSVFISVDTGPIYIAEAFGVATIDIIGPIDEREQPPIGPRHAIVVAKRAKPELYVLNARVYDRVEARRQVDAITVDDVMRAFYGLFPSRKSS